MAGGSGHSVDFVRKGLIVASLFAALILLHLYAVPSGDFDPRGLLALGFVILAAYLIGELAELIKLPHITGYLLAGLALGESVAHALPHVLPERFLVAPFDTGILNAETIKQLSLLDALALPLISLTAGGALKLDEIRKAIKPIFGILTGQVVLVVVGCVGLFYLMSGPLPWLTMPQLVDQPLAVVLALGGVVAAISIATSDAATIAIIVSTKAKGPMTTNSISVAVLKDIVVVVAFAVATTLAAGALGREAGSLGESLLKLLISTALGVGLGWGIHLYLKYVRAEVLLFLVGVIYAVTFIAEPLELEVALIFIAAGFVAANYSTSGDELIREVERLSMPVFVVFFTLAGAKLHLDMVIEMARFAAALVIVRTGALWLGCRFGAIVGGADPMSTRYGWMAFVSQAGLAITLANNMPADYGPELGGALFSFILAGVAVNEIIGPAMLQSGLALAGEIPGSGKVDDEAATSAPGPGGQALAAPELEKVARKVEAAIDDELAGFEAGPLRAALRRDEVLIRDLRRAFLRQHRHLMVQVRADPSALPERIRAERARLGARWQELALDRARAAHPWRPASLAAALDRAADHQPERVAAPLEPSSLAPRDEPRVARVRRGWLRLRHRLRAIERDVAAREVVRYHLSGRAPGQLAALAAAQQDAEGALAEQIAGLFRQIDEDCDALARMSVESPDGLEAALRAARRDTAAAFSRLSAARSEASASTLALARALGAELSGAVREDLAGWGTMDLPPWRRRFGRVFRERNAGLEALSEGLGQGRALSGARFQALALELELFRLEDRLYEAVDEHGGALAREIRGRGVTQLHRVEESLGTALEALEASLAPEPDGAAEGGAAEGGDAIAPSPLAETGAALAVRVRELTEPLLFEVTDGRRKAEELRARLASGAAIAPCRAALLAQAAELTDRYSVPSSAASSSSSGGELADIPLRQIAQTFVEAVFTRDLRDMTQTLEGRVAGLRDTLVELERVLAFNAELASAELEPWSDEPPPAETMALVRELLLGALRRSHDRVVAAAKEAAPWGDQALDALRAEVAREIELLRRQALSGDAGALDRLSGRGPRPRRSLSSRTEQLEGRVEQLRTDGVRLLRRAVGQEALERWRVDLGLPAPPLDARPLSIAVAPRAAHGDVPAVYQRLFAGQGLDVGDLLPDRERHLQAARSLLGPAPDGRLRTLAVTSAPGGGAAALAMAIGRELGAESRRLAPGGPVEPEDVAAWFESPRPGRVNLVDGLGWLFALRPGGQWPLRRFVEGVLADAGRERWILIADRATWRAATSLEALGQVFSEGVHLAPLEADALQEAILTRHVMSGYSLRFEAPESEGWLLGPDERARRVRAGFFRDLRVASGGVLGDALRLWIGAITRVDEETGVVWIGEVPGAPLRRLAQLPDDDLLLLGQALRQGWMDASLAAELFDLDPAAAAAQIAGLARSGIFEAHGDRHRVALHLRAAIGQVLEARGWL